MKQAIAILILAAMVAASVGIIAAAVMPAWFQRNKPRILALIAFGAVLGMSVAPAFLEQAVSGSWQPIDGTTAAPAPPETMTAFTITNTTYSGEAWCSYAAGDTLTVNAGGTFIFNTSVGGAGSGAITVNAGGILIINAGVSLEIATGTAINIVEGGQMFCMGTSASGVTLVGNDKTSSTHQIKTTTGGRLICYYTTISNFYYIGQVTSSGIMEFYNCTITDIGYPFYSTAYGQWLFVNCSIAQTTAARYILQPTNIGIVTAINTAFTSATDNKLAGSTFFMQCSFAGCTYQGAAISSDDFDATTQDIDLRIYEASHLTSNVATAKWTYNHPEMDSTGMIYDDDNYMRVPGVLGGPGSGNGSVWLLNRTAFWRSGLAVADRTWHNVSVGDDATTDEWNITCAAWNYATNSTEVYSGTNATINLTATAPPTTAGVPGLEGINTFYSYLDGTYADHQANYTWGDDMFGEARVTWNAAINDVFCNATLYNPGGFGVAWWNASYDFAANATTSSDTIFGIGLSYDTANSINGSFYLVISFEQENISATFVSMQYAVLAELIPGLIDGAWIFPYNALGNFQAKYNIGDHVYPDGGATWTYGISGCYVNASVWNDLGLVEVLDTATEDYTAGVEIVFSITFGAVLDIDLTAYAAGDYLIEISFEHPGIVDTFVYGEFTVLANATGGTGDGAALVDVRTYSDNLTSSRCNNFTQSQTIYLNATIQTNLNITNASVVVSLWNVAGFITELANASWNFTAAVDYNLTEISGAVVSWLSNAAGQHHVMINITNSTGFYNSTVTTEGFYVRALPAVPGPSTGGESDDSHSWPTVETSRFEAAFQTVIIAVADNWFPLLFLACMIAAFVWFLEQTRRKRKVRQ